MLARRLRVAHIDTRKVVADFAAHAHDLDALALVLRAPYPLGDLAPIRVDAALLGIVDAECVRDAELIESGGDVGTGAERGSAPVGEGTHPVETRGDRAATAGN